MVDYFLPDGYQERLEPEYFHDEGMDAVWQPDVYPEAAALARAMRSRTIVDLGCGDGSKLTALHPEFQIIGIDVGANIERAREHGFGMWIELNLDSDEVLPIDDFSSTLLICADVLEHLVRPEVTLARIRDALARGADAVVLSTPERDLSDGEPQCGPPTNPAHVREWSRDELIEFLASCGLDAFSGLTRSNDYLDQLRTTIAIVPGDTAERRRLVELWATFREPWERRAAESAEKLAHERWRVEEFAVAAREYARQREDLIETLSACERARAEAERATAEAERARERAERRAVQLEQPLNIAKSIVNRSIAGTASRVGDAVRRRRGG